MTIYTIYYLPSTRLPDPRKKGSLQGADCSAEGASALQETNKSQIVLSINCRLARLAAMPALHTWPHSVYTTRLYTVHPWLLGSICQIFLAMNPSSPKVHWCHFQGQMMSSTIGWAGCLSACCPGAQHSANQRLISINLYIYLGLFVLCLKSVMNNLRCKPTTLSSCHERGADNCSVNSNLTSQLSLGAVVN